MNIDWVQFAAFLVVCSVYIGAGIFGQTPGAETKSTSA